MLGSLYQHPPEQPRHPPVLASPHGGVSKWHAQGAFCGSSPVGPGCQSSDGGRTMGKAHVLGLQSTLKFGPCSPAVPHPEATPRIPTCAWCSLGAAGCIGGVVIATLPNSVAKGHGSAGELQESWRSERQRVERGAGGTRAHPACTTVSMRDGARAGLLCRATEGMLLCGVKDYPSRI